MLVVETTGQRDRAATGSGRNGNERVAGADSKAFARWSSLGPSLAALRYHMYFRFCG